MILPSVSVSQTWSSFLTISSWNVIWTSHFLSPSYLILVRFEVFTTVNMKNVVFWDVTPCDSCKNRRFRGNLRTVLRLLVTANVVPSSQFLVTLMKETLSYSETSLLIRAPRRNIPEDTILSM
jgi:hypothetical protein